MRLRTAIAALVSLAAIPSAASAETLLANDSVGETINAVTAAAELIEGEMYEVVFDIPADWLPIEMLGVRVVMVEGCNPDFLGTCQPAAVEWCAQYGMEVWEEGTNSVMSTQCIDPGTFGYTPVEYKEPGMNLFSQERDAIDGMTGTPYGFEIVGDPAMGNATFKDLRFSAINMNQNITLNPVMLNSTRIRIGLKALSTQCTQGGQIREGKHPVLAGDDDGVSADYTNFIYGEPLVPGLGSMCPDVMGPEHYAWEDFGPVFSRSRPGDFIMRLILNRDDPNAMPDMGMGGDDMGPDMNEADMGGGMTDTGSGNDMGGGMTDMGGGGDDTGGSNNGVGGALEIESITPDEGPADASTNVVIIGSGFEAGAQVLLGADNIGVTETLAERIRATVPEGLTPGSYDVIVTNPDGESAILADGYTVVEGAADPGDGKTGASADGCCSEVSGANRSSLLGFAIVAFLLTVIASARRRVHG